MAVNFSDTTPAATATHTNVTWQKDGSGNISAQYVSTAGGDLTGTLPSPTVTQVNGAAIPASANTVGTNSSRQFIDTSASTNGFRNRIINGGGQGVDQRNAGAAQTITAGAALAYTIDRWYGYCTGANVTGQRIAGSGGAQFRYQFTGAASVTAIGFGQRIETNNSFDMANQTVTLSVELANSLLTTVTWTAYYANTADTFGTLASPTRTQIATGTFTVTSSIVTYSTQISIPSAATTGIEIVFTVGAQTSGTWKIGNVQLEIGSNATPFERRPYTLELALAQRYYQYIGKSASSFQMRGYNVTSAALTQTIILPVVMRIAPTATIQGSPSYTNGSALSYAAAPGSGQANMLVTSTGDAFVFLGATSWIDLLAEL